MLAPSVIEMAGALYSIFEESDFSYPVANEHEATQYDTEEGTPETEQKAGELVGLPQDLKFSFQVENATMPPNTPESGYDFAGTLGFLVQALRGEHN
jgi:hypothetical protein